MEKELKSESLILFENKNENIEKNENTKAKKTLFTILNGERVDLEIEDINALSQKCKNDNNSSDIIEIKIKEFHDWIGVPLPKELEHKKTILDFFKKKKSEN